MRFKLILNYTPAGSVTPDGIETWILDNRPWYRLDTIADALATTHDNSAKWRAKQVRLAPEHTKKRLIPSTGRVTRGRHFFESKFYLSWEGLSKILLAEKTPEAAALYHWLAWGDGRAFLREMQIKP